MCPFFELSLKALNPGVVSLEEHYICWYIQLVIANEIKTFRKVTLLQLEADVISVNITFDIFSRLHLLVLIIFQKYC